MPVGFKEARWNAAMNNLRSDIKWDEEVLNCIKKRTNGDADPAFFELSDTLRDDFCYWRNRRNDCAHYKDSEITPSHVSAFWIFIMDNYNKFSPLGSVTQSINEYKRHYDISLTPKGTSTEGIFKRLCLAIKTRDDLWKFLKETSDRMDFGSQCDLLHELLVVEEHHKKLVVSFLKENMTKLKAYLCAKPTDVSLILGDDATLTRKLWYDDFCLFCNCMNVYAEMLRAKMLDDNEIEESLGLYLEHEYKQGHFFIENDDVLNVLMENGLYNIFIDKYLTKSFVCSNPGEKCRKTDFYLSLICRGGITDKLILTLSKSVVDTFPYTLRDRMIAEIFSKNEFKAKYLETIERLNLDDFFNLK